VNFSEQVPSAEWAPLKYEGEEIAESRVEPEGEGLALVFRVLRNRVEVADVSRRVTLDKLLKAAAVSQDEVESWRLEDASRRRPDGADPEASDPPARDCLFIRVHLQRRSDAEGGGQEIPPETWQALEALWKAILGLEASIDASRLSLDGLRAEMEAAFKRPLAVDEKLHALQSDVAQLNGAKNRVHYALPKVREFIHRATWAAATPERKRLEEVFKNHIEPRNPLPEVDRVRAQLEHLQKDRQVLFAQGNSVAQECRGILGEIGRALSTLQRNAAENARRKRDAKSQKGKRP
jgi:hypothetical protein